MAQIYLNRFGCGLVSLEPVQFHFHVFQVSLILFFKVFGLVWFRFYVTQTGLALVRRGLIQIGFRLQCFEEVLSSG